MITTIAKKEILVSMISVRFVVTVLVCCLLMPLSTWVLSNDYMNDMDDYEARVDLEARRNTQGKQFQYVANRPVPPLSSLFRGINSTSVNSVTLKYYVGWNMPLSAGRQSVTNAIFPTVDIAFVVGVVLSALALMLSFDALSGEKNQSTLRLMMSNSISRSSIVLGKWLGLSAVILIPFALGLILSLLVFFFITGVQLAGTEVVALVIALFVTMLYLVLFVLIGITISSLTNNPALSILTSLGVWGVLVFILPQLSNALATELVEIRTPQMIEHDIRRAYNKMAYAMREKNMKITSKAKRDNIPYREWNPERTRGDFALVKENRQATNKIERQYWLEVQQQEARSRMIGMISPFSSLNHALMSLATTGPATQRSFMRQAYSYGERYFFTIWDTRFSSDLEWENIIDAQPPFAFKPLTLEERIDGALLPTSAIILFMVILALVAVLTFNQYDVR